MVATQQQYDEAIEELIEENYDFIQAETPATVAQMSVVAIRPMGAKTVTHYSGDPWVYTRLWPKDVHKFTHQAYPLDEEHKPESERVESLRDYAVELFRRDVRDALDDYESE